MSGLITLREGMPTLRWLGHAAFELTADGKKILIDPFLTDNPKAPIKGGDVREADVICVTHDHHDHLGDSIDICKRTGAAFVSVYELGLLAESEGVEDVVGMNLGGTVRVRGIYITLVQAIHSSARGSPVGFVIRVEDKSVYHAGDTALFADMSLIGKFYRPDVACIPIGDYYVMGPREAAEAAELLAAPTVIPMHYLTFPVLKQSADEFVEEMSKRGLANRVVVLQPGETYSF
jgi:L-ascorbate metabolism protein UlaG (beta-lactamase superfamily)